MPSEMRVATRAGHRLHTVRWDRAQPAEDGAPLLLVHGLASNQRLWDGVATALADAGRTAVAVDQRGHGRSERGDGFDPAQLCADLIDVLDAHGIDQALVAGQSWGGQVVLELAGRVPERVDGVVCVDGGFFAFGDRYASAEEMWEELAPPRFDDLTRDQVRAGMADRTAGWPDGAADAQLANLCLRPDGTVEANLRRDDHEAIVRRLFSQHGPTLAAAVTAPTLLLPAAAGSQPPPGKAALVDALDDALDDAEVRWMLEADHDVHLQKPDEVAAAILDWSDGLVS